jgi:hypothetical protein
MKCEKTADVNEKNVNEQIPHGSLLEISLRFLTSFLAISLLFTMLRGRNNRKEKTMKPLYGACIILFILGLQFSPAQTPAPPASGGSELSLTSAPEDQEPDNIFTYRPRWGVGIQAGLLSGSGLGVRYHPLGRFAGQFVAGGFTASKKFIWSFGFEGQFDFDVMKQSRFYGLAGFGVYSTGTDDSTSEAKLKAPVRLGLGIGYEWAMNNKMVFYIDLMFTYFAKESDFLPLPQIGMFYYFR